MSYFERWMEVARFEPWVRAGRWRAWLRSPLRPVPVVLATACALAAHGKSRDPSAPTPEDALAQALASRGLVCEAADVSWIIVPSGLFGSLRGSARALVRAHVGDEPNDLYLVDARLSPEGALLDAGSAWNITETSGVDESRPIVQGARAVYTTLADGFCTAMHVLDLAGRAPAEADGLNRVQRAQIALTNLQHTGQTQGVVHDSFTLDPVARKSALSWRADGLIELVADDRTVVVDPIAKRVVSGEAFVHVLLDERARPGNLVTWAVDRVRAMPWFGDDRMQWVKAVAFTALDRWHAQFSSGSSAQDVADELGLTQPSAAPTFVDPDVGWPPPPIKTVASQPLPGEGRWIALDRDPFITRIAGAPAPAFVTSFVRPDVHRLDVRVYVTLWDPRRVAMHMEAGSVEPVGASGEHGPGLVPRTPEVIRRLVAGFNGGFQPQHGEYGMRANGIDYLPPKPYAATVVELRDGSNGFGAWPGPGVEAEVSGDIVALRQNLTALVEFGKYNPWGRTWWGGTPPGWPDQIHSTRSALCLTAEGFVGYFYGPSISAEDLALGMLDARCTFGIHLDMNPGHAGFEFYNVEPEGQLPSLGRPLQGDWEAEGRVPDMAGYVFRSRRMIRGMGHMLFPRYIQREARDFFYLTERAVLPGAALDGGQGADPDEGVWRTRGLPQHGFPYAIATAWVRGGADRAGPKLRVLRADPRAVQPAAATNAQDPTIVSFAGGTRGALSLFWQGGVFSIASTAPTRDAAELAQGSPWTSPAAAQARAAVGVEDEDGMLVWVELAPDSPAGPRSAAAMESLLAKLGCSERMTLSGEARALLGGSLDISGAPAPASHVPITARLVRARAPDAHTIFDATPVVPSSVWQPLQAKRVRYFYKPSSTSSSTPTTPAAPSAASNQ